MAKTYNSGDSLAVPHQATSAPVKGLTCGEQTGSSVLLHLWSYVEEWAKSVIYEAVVDELATTSWRCDGTQL